MIPFFLCVDSHGYSHLAHLMSTNTILILGIVGIGAAAAVGYWYFYIRKSCPYDDGAVIRCTKDGKVFRIDDSRRRHFTPSGYAAAGSPKFREVSDCADLTKCEQGDDI